MTNPALLLTPLVLAQAPPGINTRPTTPQAVQPEAPISTDTFESPIPIRKQETGAPTRLSALDAYIRRGHNDPATKRMQELGLTLFFSDGSFSRPGDSGRYYYQTDGSIFYTGGIVDSKYTPPSTLVNETWDKAKDKPLPGTFAIASLDLVPQSDGSFLCGRNHCTGKYFIQPNGTIWYEGGNIDGLAKTPQTYNPTTGWDPNLKEPDIITKYGIRPHGDGWVHVQSKTILTNAQLEQLRVSGYFTTENDPRKYVILPDGRIFTPGGGSDPKNPELGGYITNGSWTEDPRTKDGSAYLAAYHDLIPANDGSGEFIRPNSSGYRYIAQEDGSIFQYHPEWFTDSSRSKEVFGPMTLRNGVWNFVGPIKPQDYIRVYGLTQQANGSYTNPKIYNGKFYLRENKLYWLSSDDSKCFLLNNEGKWVEQQPKK